MSNLMYILYTNEIMLHFIHGYIFRSHFFVQYSFNMCPENRATPGPYEGLRKGENLAGKFLHNKLVKLKKKEDVVVIRRE